MANPTFNIDSRHNPDARFKKVLFGYDGKLLEVELNELQDVVNARLGRLVNSVFGNRPLFTGTYIVSGGTLTLTNEVVAFNNELIVIPTGSIAVTSGNTIYLNIQEKTVKGTDTLRKYGNSKGSEVITNEIQDPRIGEETTRRVQLVYEFTKAGSGGAGVYIKLGTISGTNFVKNTNDYADSDLYKEIRRLATEQVIAYGTETTTGAQTKANTAEKNAKDFAKAYGLGDIAKDVSGTDLNNLALTGFFKGNNLANSPTGNLAHYFFIINMEHSNSNRVQVAFHYGTGSPNVPTMWLRNFRGSTWFAWDTMETAVGAQMKIDASQKFKLTQNDGKALRIPVGLSSLSILTTPGFYYFTTAESSNLTDHPRRGVGGWWLTISPAEIGENVVQEITRNTQSGEVERYWRTVNPGGGTASKWFAHNSNTRLTMPVDTDALTLPAGLYQVSKGINMPMPQTDTSWFSLDVVEGSTTTPTMKQLYAIRSFDARMWYGTVHTDGVFTGWKEVETVAGAQAKADQAETRAKSASTPSAHAGSSGSAHGVANQSTAGFMAPQDKAKLDGVATGAQVNQDAFSFIKVGLNTIQADTPTDTLEIIPGERIAIAPDTVGDKFTISVALETQDVLWAGGTYPRSADIITPTKALSKCRNGWILVWSDYDFGVGSNDFHWVFSVIPKEFAKFDAGGATFFSIPNFVSETTIQHTIKTLYVNDGTLQGSEDNYFEANYGRDVSLRRVLEF